MPTGTVGLYPKFRADDADGNPLEGGKLYSFLSGTTTPHALYADPELTTPLPNPVILDASGEALFYTNGAAMAWRLDDADDTTLWTIDPVAGATGGAGAAGLGFGKQTVLMHPAAGTAQLSALVFPADVLALAVTVWCSEAFGAAQGLTHVGIGSAEQPDLWGHLARLDLAAASTVGHFLVYGGQPQPVASTVVLTAYGGLFDGLGALYVTGHFLTCTPGQTPGYLYTPSTPEAGQILPPLPPASDTVAGIVELATPTEVTTGTDTTRAVTPAGLAARVPSGTPLRVARYASGGTTLEASPVVIDAAGNVGIGQPTPLTPLHVVGELRITDNVLRVQRDGSNAGLIAETSHDTPTITALLQLARARGTTALRTAVQSGDSLARMALRGYGSAMGDAVSLEALAEETFSATARGGRLTLSTVALATTTMTERLRIDSQGRIGLHTTLSATLGSGATYQALSVKGSLLAVAQSSVQERPQALIAPSWVVSTDASRTARLTVSAYDATAAREGLRVEADGTAARLGFYGAAAVARPTVTGSRGGNAAVASALSALASLGLITDSSSA